MTEANQLIAVLKSQLKLQGLTYKDVGAALQLSEPSVKRLFASKRLTVDRLGTLECVSGVLPSPELDFEEALRQRRPEPAMLTFEQEAQLASDTALLLVSARVLNQWSLADIVAVYEMSEVECLKVPASTRPAEVD